MRKKCRHYYVINEKVHFLSVQVLIKNLDIYIFDIILFEINLYSIFYFHFNNLMGSYNN